MESLSKQNKIFIEKINKKVGKLINDNNLIDEADKILVAVSGGKDSLVLLDILWQRLRKIPIKYEIIAVHVSLVGLSYQIDKNLIKKFCDIRNINFKIIEEKVDINLSNKSPCFICSNTRRKLLFEYAVANNCNKLAFGHHMDDAVETLLMNMMYHANISSIPYKIKMFDDKFQIIRPLLKIRDAETKKYSEIFKYPKMKNLCSFEDKTKRKFASELINSMENNYKNSISSIFASMKNIDNDYLP